MSKPPIIIPLIAALFVGTAIAGARADDSAAQNEGQAGDDQAPVPLTIGSMAIASDVNLAIESMAVDVSVNRVTYTYKLRNKGKEKLSLRASVAMPDLEVSSDGSSVTVLPSQTPENPIDLQVKSNDQPVPTTSHVSAIALGIDQQAELKAAGIPLIPFGESTDRAIAAAKPDVLSKLTNFGLLTPRDPKQPDAQVIGDWSLKVVQGWTQIVDPGTSNVAVTFAPIKATYQVDASGLAGFDPIKDQVCLTPAVTNAARALLKTKGAVLQVDDIMLANDGPARWLDNPTVTVAVHKPQPNAVVSFCGMEAASANKPVVTGKMAKAGDAAGARVLVFSLLQN